MATWEATSATCRRTFRHRSPRRARTFSNKALRKPPLSRPCPRARTVSQLPQHAQDQVAAQGETLAQNDVQATGDVSPESGPPTDWGQKPGGDVPEPAQVDQTRGEGDVRPFPFVAVVASL
jgi:hypothetical protein